ncbi:hypothetical protein ACHAXT_003658 [Thalassiosira profunda]
MASKSTQALLSWSLDAAASVLILGLLAAWLADLQNPDNNPSYLSKSFVENGFCLSHRFDCTHTSCSILDGVCGMACLIAMAAGKLPSSAVGSAAYFLAHGYAHYEIGRTGVNGDRGGMGLIDSLGLAIIISIGPIAMASSLVEAKKMSRSAANAVAAPILAALVATYHVYVKQPRYALLYINVSITLCAAVPKALLVGFRSEEDIHSRSSKFHWPGFLASALIVTVIICEPFFCEQFISSIGGHLIFDTSLALGVLSDMVKEHGDRTNDEAKLKTT